MRSSRLWLAAIVAFGSIFALTTTLWHHGVDGPLTNAIDFRAFYCAGAALDHGADPYRVEPVRSCERDALATAGFGFAQRDVLETPYPPIAIAAIGLLGFLPYRIAVELWLTIGIASLAAAIVATGRLTGLRPIFITLALIASLGFASFYYGQPVPLAVAGLTLAALAARREHGVWVAAGLVLASVQPHLALPAWIGAAAFVPAARKPLAIAAAAIAAIALVFYAQLTFEYLRIVLPSHARAEIANFDIQYGLSSLLLYAGMPITWAMRLGTLSYVAMLGVGAYVARALVRRFDDPAFAILTPAALITIGGTYLHGHQIAVAIPFAFLLWSRLRSTGGVAQRLVLATAICALAVPWNIMADRPWAPNAAYAHPPAYRTPRAGEMLDQSYGERQDIVRARDGYSLAFVAWKLPTWLALLAVLATSVDVTTRRKNARA